MPFSHADIMKADSMQKGADTTPFPDGDTAGRQIRPDNCQNITKRGINHEYSECNTFDKKVW